MKSYYSLSIFVGSHIHTLYGSLNDLKKQKEEFHESIGKFTFTGHTQYLDMKLIEITIVQAEVDVITITHFGD